MTKKLIAIAGSVRTSSFNVGLADAITKTVNSSGLGIEAERIDLRNHPMPLMSEDEEAANGIPQSAQKLHEIVADADAVLLVCPEYNGAFTPLLKNTVDWVSRIDPGFLAGKSVALASASPGPGGGARGLDLVRQWLQNMGIEPVATTVVAPAAYEIFGPEGQIVREDVVEAIQRLVADISASLGAVVG